MAAASLNPLQKHLSKPIFRPNVKYLMIRSGYTFRLVGSDEDDLYEMDLVAAGDSKYLEYKDGKCDYDKWYESVNKSIAQYHDKLKASVVAKSDTKDKDSTKSCTEDNDGAKAILIVDYLDGKGLYVNPKSEHSDVLWILDQIKSKDEYLTGIVVFGDVESAWHTTEKVCDRDYCYWHHCGTGNIEYIDYGTFHLAYVNPDTESG